MKSRLMAVACSLALAPGLFAGAEGPSANPEDQFRFLWGFNHGVYPELRDAGFNTLFDANIGLSFDFRTGKPRAGRDKVSAEFMELADRMRDDGVDFVLQVSGLSSDKHLKEKYFRVTRDGKKVVKTLDAGDPACLAELRTAARCFAAEATKLPCAVGVQPTSEVQIHTEPSFTPRVAEAFRKATGMEIPDAARGRAAPHWSKLADMPADRVVDEDYPVLSFYRWFWREGDGFHPYCTMVVDEFSAALGHKPFSVFDPCIRLPPIWGAGGSVTHLNQWQTVTPVPFQQSYIISEQMAMARGCPGQRVLTMVQGINGRKPLAPPDRHVEGPLPAWCADRPNGTYITPAPDLMREAIWTVFSRRTDGIGFHGWNCLLDGVPHGCKKTDKGYVFTNPETFPAIAQLFREVGIPLGPLFKRMPERDPEVAVFEGYAAALLSGRAPWDWKLAGNTWGVVATAASLNPYTLYEEEIARSGIPRSVKVIIAPECGVITRKACDAFREFQRRGGMIIADADLAPALKADALLEKYPSPRFHADDGDVESARLFEFARRLRSTVSAKIRPHVSVTHPRMLASARHCGDAAECLFVINDNRGFGDYLGPWRRCQEKGLPAEGEVVLRRTAKAVYDLVRHQAVKFRLEGGNTVVPVRFATSDGRALLAADRPLRPLKAVWRRVDGGTEVSVSSPDVDVLVPLEVAVGAKKTYGVVAAGVWKRVIPNTDGTVVVRNLATGESATAAAAAPVRAKDLDREKVLKFFHESVYGPPVPPPASLEFELRESGEAFDGFAERRQYAIRSRDAKGGHSFDVLVYLPKRTKGPVPTFVYPNMSGNHSLVDDPAVIEYAGHPIGGKRRARGSRTDRVPVREILNCGFAFATFCYGAVYPDYPDRDAALESAYAIFPAEKLPKELLAHPIWSWGSSRVRDLLERLPEIDQAKVAVAGQSRMGKNAIYTGVHDSRFALTCANCGGTKSLRYLPNILYPYWFSEKLKAYVRIDKTGLSVAELKKLRDNALQDPPFDQSEFVGCIAPRALIVSVAAEDRWSPPEGSRELVDAANLYFAKFKASIGWHHKEGPHSITAEDWRFFMDYAKEELKW